VSAATRALVAAAGAALGLLGAGPAGAECLFLTDGTVVEGRNVRTEGAWVKYDQSPTVTIGVPKEEVRRVGPCPPAPARFTMVRAESFSEPGPGGPTRGMRIHVVPEDWARTDEIAARVAADWPGMTAVHVLFWGAASDMEAGRPLGAVAVRGGKLTPLAPAR
jgi:hypothetical protein